MRGALLLIVIVGSVACSDDSDDDVAVETTRSVAAFCERAALLIAGNESIDILGTDSPPDEVEAAFDELRAAYDRLEGAAPTEIVDDVADTADAFDDVVDAVAAVGYDLAALDPDVYSPVRERYLTASGDIESYLATAC